MNGKKANCMELTERVAMRLTESEMEDTSKMIDTLRRKGWPITPSELSRFLLQPFLADPDPSAKKGVAAWPWLAP